MNPPLPSAETLSESYPQPPGDVKHGVFWPMGSYPPSLVLYATVTMGSAGAATCTGWKLHPGPLERPLPRSLSSLPTNLPARSPVQFTSPCDGRYGRVNVLVWV